MRPLTTAEQMSILWARIDELEKAIGVCVPAIIRCYKDCCVAQNNPEDAELCDRVLARVNKAMEKAS